MMRSVRWLPCVFWYLVLTDSKISALSERTGVAAVCFFSRTHLEDSFEPNWICSPNSAWKSGPVRFFVQILKDRDQDRSSQVERPRKTGLNRHQPVQCGFSRFFTVLRPVSTSFSLNRLITGLGPVLELLTVTIEKYECNLLP